MCTSFVSGSIEFAILRSIIKAMSFLVPFDHAIQFLVGSRQRLRTRHDSVMELPGARPDLAGDGENLSARLAENMADEIAAAVESIAHR
jgi:hypothetical protein